LARGTLWTAEAAVPASPEAQGVGGVVVDEQGRPVAGVRLLLKGVQLPRQEATKATTDEEGRFRFAGVRAIPEAWKGTVLDPRFAGLEIDLDMTSRREWDLVGEPKVGEGPVRVVVKPRKY
jgi:hypothetical protein